MASKGLGSSKIPADLGSPSPTKANAATHIGALGHNKSEPQRAAIPLYLNDAGETERVGHYEVVGTLGRGGMGIVYEVVDGRSGSIYALKAIETRFLELPESAAESRFKHEISVLERLDHPGVVRLFDSGFARHPMGYDLAFFAMERLDGDTLDADIKAGRIFELPDALDVIAQLTDALDYLAKNGVLHRDIKPANIFREPAGRVVLMDFGLARSEEFTRLTLAGQIVGTFGYMSPERLCGKKLDISSDVYALGVVLFQMLSGRHPFEAPSPTEMLEAIKRGVSFPERFAELPRAGEVKEMILSMLAYGMEARPSPTALRTRIADLLSAIEETSPTSHSGSQPQQRMSSGDRNAATRSIPPLRSPPPPVPPPTAAQSELTPIIERKDDRPSIKQKLISGAQVSPLAPQLQVAPVSNLPFVAPSHGPSWATTGLLTTAAACVAFLAGLLVGRTQQPEVIVPVNPRGGEQVQPVVPIEKPRASVKPVEEREAQPIPASSLHDPAAAYDVGEQLIAESKYAQAIEFLNRALELNPAYANAHKLLGDAYAGTGDKERAQHHYKTYLALRPGADDAASVRRAMKALGP